MAFAETFLHCPAGCANCVSGFALTGGVFFAEIQRSGIHRHAGRRDVAAPAEGQQKGRTTCGFPSSLNSCRFPCFLIWRRLPTRDRFDMGNGRGCFLPCLSQHCCAVSDTVLLHMRFHLRGRDIPVSRNSFSRYSAQHLRVLIDNKCYRRVRRPRRTVSNGWYNLSRRGGTSDRPNHTL